VLQQLCHAIHGLRDVPKVFKVARTQVIQPILPIGRSGKSILGAFAVTCKLVGATATNGWEAIFLGRAKALLLW